MVGTVTSYQQIASNLEKSLVKMMQRADVKHECDYFLANIGNITSIDAFIKDDQLFGFAMTAFGLKDMIYGKAFMRKVLSEGLDGEDSFAMQLADTRFREFAEAFNFARLGPTATATDLAQRGTVDRFVRMQLEIEAGELDEGLRLALYFRRKAASVTSVYGLMGDSTLYRVLQTALGLPAAYSSAEIDKQAAIISSKLDIEDFKNSAKLEAFVATFVAKWQTANGDSSANSPVVGLSQSVLATFDNSLLLSLQNIRRHG